MEIQQGRLECLLSLICQWSVSTTFEFLAFLSDCPWSIPKQSSLNLTWQRVSWRLTLSLHQRHAPAPPNQRFQSLGHKYENFPWSAFSLPWLQICGNHTQQTCSLVTLSCQLDWDTWWSPSRPPSTSPSQPWSPGCFCSWEFHLPIVSYWHVIELSNNWTLTAESIKT